MSNLPRAPSIKGVWLILRRCPLWALPLPQKVTGDTLLIQFEIALSCIRRDSSSQLRPLHWKIPIQPPESKAKIRSCKLSRLLPSARHLKEAEMSCYLVTGLRPREENQMLLCTPAFPAYQCLLFQGQKPPFLTHPRTSENSLPSNWGLLSVQEGCPYQPLALIISP